MNERLVEVCVCVCVGKGQQVSFVSPLPSSFSSVPTPRRR